jgi:type VI secretion system protein ImpG
MTDDLLVYYNHELSYIRKLGKEFSRAHPDVAPLLRLDAESGQDPYVERLLEGVAYLTARVRKKLDDDFPEIAEAMLNVLYPHFTAPLPSMAIAQFQLDPSQTGMIGGSEIPRGSRLETEEVEAEPCWFRTCFDLRLFPLRIAGAELVPLGRRPNIPLVADAQTVVRLRLTTYGADGPVSKLELDGLRFFISGEPIHANAMYEALFTDLVGVALADGPDDPRPVLLPLDCVRPVGFDSTEAILPFGARSFPGYRLLTEYFALPEKFRFIDVTGLTPARRARFGTRAELLFFLKHRHEPLQPNVSGDMFRLGCTPIVNLFEQKIDGFRLSHMRSRYHVVPDVRRVHAREIYSVDRVSATTADGQSIDLHPVYSSSHPNAPSEQQAFWFATRRSAGYVDGRFEPGTEIDLAFVDPGFSPAGSADWTIYIVATCLNRDLPSRLPFGADRPRIARIDKGALATVRCLTPPTPTRRSPQGRGTLWRLISHLCLNHLSLVEGDKAAESLREMLTLYDRVRSAATSAKVQGIKRARSQRVTRRLRIGSASGVCRGVEVSVDFDEAQFADNGVFLFASVLERFLPLYCSINSFVQFAACSPRREDGVIYRWPPRTAEKHLL